MSIATGRRYPVAVASVLALLAAVWLLAGSIRRADVATNVAAITVNRALATGRDSAEPPPPAATTSLTRLHAVQLSRQGDFAAALPYWRAVPDAAVYLRGWGQIAWELGQDDEAVQWYALLTSIDPAPALHHYRYALALERTGQLDAALQALDRAEGGVPSAEIGVSEIAFYRARIAAQQPQPDWPAVLALLDDAVAADDYRESGFVAAQVHYLRGEALTALQRLDDALDAYAQAAALNPAHYEARIRWGNLLLSRQAAPAAARDVFCTALAIDPQRVPAYLGLGRALNAADDPDGAARAFNAALALDPTNTTAQDWLSRLPGSVPAAPSAPGELCGATP